MTAPPRAATRIAIACAVGLLAYLITSTYLAAQPAHVLGADFTFWWRAARVLLDGQSPYQVIRATGPYPFSDPFYYPLPAAIVTLPLARLDPRTGAAVFTGLSSALLAFGLTRDGYARLPLLCSAPMLAAVIVGQWSPLITAAALLPALGFLFVAKPNLGLAAFVYRPSWLAALGGGALLLASFVVAPHWMTQWRSVIATTLLHRAPVMLVGGPVLLLALLRWRRPEARLMIAMVLLPQAFFFYDQLPVLLVCRTLGESAIVAASSLVALVLSEHLHAGATRLVAERTNAGFTLVFVYLPALVVLLRRPNEGPGLVESLRAVMVAPRRLITRLGAPGRETRTTGDATPGR